MGNISTSSNNLRLFNILFSCFLWENKRKIIIGYWKKKPISRHSGSFENVGTWHWHWHRPGGNYGADTETN